MSPVAEALKRAKLRISAHGFHPGETEPRRGRQPRKGFLGYSVKEAVLGLPLAGETTPIGYDESTAIFFVEEAIATLHPEIEAADRIQAFNDTPGRTVAQVFNVLERAFNLARKAEPKLAPVSPETKFSPGT